jgi:hypothetical protein
MIQHRNDTFHNLKNINQKGGNMMIIGIVVFLLIGLITAYFLVIKPQMDNTGGNDDNTGGNDDNTGGNDDNTGGNDDNTGGNDPKPLTAKKVGTRPIKAWSDANKPYYDGNKTYEACQSECLSDPKCKTLTRFRTYASAPSRPCRYYDTIIPTSDISDVGGTWEGAVSYRESK